MLLLGDCLLESVRDAAPKLVTGVADDENSVELWILLIKDELQVVKLPQ